MSLIVETLRIQQYIKNTFILLPLFFSGRMTHYNLLFDNLVAFMGLCFVSSGIYIFNDILDIDEDKKHPMKQKRPIASGKLDKKTALSIMLVLLAVGLLISFVLSLYLKSFTVLFLFIFYIILNILYSLRLKHIPIVDINVIAIGFEIRLLIGSATSGIPLTIWIIAIVFLLALFIALAKRRDDVLMYINTSQIVRKNIDGYNLEFINASMVITAGVVLVSYIMYTISPEIISKFKTDKLYLTSIFVVMGIMRYMQITFVYQKSGSPTKVLLSDKFLQLVIFGWVVSFIVILYVRG